jgi:hypothetical protein
VTTITELMKITKDDHLAFVRFVADAVASAQVPLNGLATQHTCRLGRWYDSLTDAATLALPSLRAFVEPHHGVHECGQRAIAAISANDTAGAQRHLDDLRQYSERVLKCLDAFGAEYPATLTQQRDPVATAEAA